jgi:DNA-binding winged helix-turn-helix (wHTH) protein/tetratricopeptide (TPR) repeat protein
MAVDQMRDIKLEPALSVPASLPIGTVTGMNETRSFPDAFPMNVISARSGPSRADPQHLARHPDFRLGLATVRPSIRVVEGPAGTAPAEPRVMQVLVALVDAKGTVLTRDDLIRSCWNGQVVGDDSINRAIAEVRRIARAVEAGFNVETIPRVGYRLVVTAGSPAPEGEDTSASAAAGVPRRWAMAGGLAAVAAGAGLWTIGRAPGEPAAGLIAQARTVMLAGTPDSDSRAIALLERAVAASPENAEAWGLLAFARARAGEHALTELASPIAMTVEAARRALALDPGSADAKAALAIAVPYYGDWLAAERRFDAFLAEHPAHAFVKDSRSFFLGAVGRMRESAADRVAFAASAPFDAGMQYRLVYALWFLGRTDEADRTAARGLEIWPRHPGLWFARLWVRSGSGRLDRALAQVTDEKTRPSLPPAMIATLTGSLAAAQSRQAGEIDRATNLVVAGVSKSVAGVVNALMLLNLMGAVDAAFDVARAYYLEEGPIIAAMDWRPGQPSVPDQRRRKTNMLFTPSAKAMHRDARFMPMMQRMGLADYWNASGNMPDFLRQNAA